MIGGFGSRFSVSELMQCLGYYYSPEAEGGHDFTVKIFPVPVVLLFNA